MNRGSEVISAGVVPDLEFRDLRHADDLAPLPDFERRIWGGEGDSVSVNLLVAAVLEGGVAIGAFDRGVIVGAVFGFATREPEVLHSHYMAVDPAWRRRGLGVELKQRQRAWCLERGFTAMRWTYDPLQLANAHLNLRVLGAAGIHYHENHYGTLGGINGDLPSDRVTVRWDLLRTGSERPAPTLSVDVLPATAEEIAASAPRARKARLALRHELNERLGNGWMLVDVDRDQRRYHLARLG